MKVVIVNSLWNEEIFEWLAFENRVQDACVSAVILGSVDGFLYDLQAYEGYGQ
jgi:hypothetical protein